MASGVRSVPVCATVSVYVMWLCYFRLSWWQVWSTVFLSVQLFQYMWCDCVTLGCPDGKWGPQCSRLCNCETPTTPCNASTGCTKCPPGFTGGDCYEDLNECETNPCGANADCTNSVGTFRCDCHTGYVQLNMTACVGMYSNYGYLNINWCDSVIM